MKYYVVNSVLQGIQYKKLKPGKDITGAVTYFINLEKTSDYSNVENVFRDSDEYFNAENVFSDYDEALQYFCQKCEKSLEYHQAQIQAIKNIKDCELTCA
jgi:hypothetical protein